MTEPRLIERWLPIAALGVESLRERTPMTPYPAPNRLHVWWARRPLVASRAAVLAAVLPADADRQKFLRVLGIHGDPVNAKRLIGHARRTDNRVKDPYGYTRAYGYSPSASEREWIQEEAARAGAPFPTVLDPTAGGGSIPFETVRLGLPSKANDLNPVAVLIMRATVEWPVRYGAEVLEEYRRIAREWRRRVEDRLSPLFPQTGAPDIVDTAYLWARTITCPYCDGLVPLSPNWRLATDGAGVRLVPDAQEDPSTTRRVCGFEIVTSANQHSSGTIADGDATCPFPDCGRVIDGEEVKQQAQAGRMGEQLYAVVFKRRVVTKTKSGKVREKWERGYRAPQAIDDNSAEIKATLARTESEWQSCGNIPTEHIGELSNYDRGHRMYGMYRWRDFFSPRHLLAHGTSVQIFSDLFTEAQASGRLTDASRAAFGYLAITIDSGVNYGSRACRWDVVTERVRSVFDRHGFAMLWSYGEMALLVEGLGIDWMVEKTAKCIEELIELARPDLDLKAAVRHGGAAGLFDQTAFVPPPITITCRSADSLPYIADESVDVVVMDPPYYDNVMYAELSDFFYVWLKRTAGHVFPELFTRVLTDKDNEAVANAAKFQDQKGARRLAARDYQERMAAIFAECRRVLKPDGIMTLMFTHKATGAWDALATGLMQAGFSVSASWPINTEAEGSLHIKDKSAANSTIFLVCRPRPVTHAGDEPRYWEDVEPKVASAVRARVDEFQAAGIGGVDLYLASFGPALEEFSKHWPLRRGTPAPQPEARRRRKQQELFDEVWDPYAVTPEDALNAARREVKRRRLEQLTHVKARAELDPVTSFFVLAWDAFRAPQFPYDEALRLARAVGVDLDSDIIGRIAEKKGSDVKLWDSGVRAAKHTLGPPDGSRAWLDAIHHAANMARLRTLDAAREMLVNAGVASEPQFFAALEAVLEVLPVGQAFSGVDLEGDLAASASDFEALEKLRRLAFSADVDQPEQLSIWAEPAPV